MLKLKAIVHYVLAMAVLQSNLYDEGDDELRTAVAIGLECGKKEE